MKAFLLTLFCSFFTCGVQAQGGLPILVTFTPASHIYAGVSTSGTSSIPLPPISSKALNDVDKADMELKTYPHSSTDTIFIERSMPVHKEQPTRITLYDYLGRLVLRRPLRAGKDVVNIHDCPSGMYVMHLTGPHQISIRKFLKL